MLNDKELVFIIGPGRCLTSAVTGLFNQMGLWVGTARQKGGFANPKGFFENVFFKRVVQDMYAQMGMVCNTTEGWQTPKRPFHNSLLPYQLASAIRRDGYTGGPLALKNVQVCAILEPLKEHFPNAIYLNVIRNPAEVVESYMLKNKRNNIDVSRLKMEEWVRYAQAACEEHATNTVYAEDIIAGDTRGIQHIVEQVGLQWDQQKADEFIDPNLYSGYYKGRNVS